MRASNTISPARHQAKGCARGPRGARALRSILVAAALMLAGLLAPGARADDGKARFVYQLCDSALPGGANPTLHFTVNPGVPISYFDSCSSPGGSIGLSEWGQAEATFAVLSVGVSATPGGFVETETISGAASGLGPANDHSFIYEQPWPQNNAGESSHTFFVRREAAGVFSDGGFNILLNCDGKVGPCGAGPTIWARDIAATEVDPHPPTLANVTGSLLAGAPLRGHQTLNAEAHDEGGGLSKISVLVNGLPATLPVVGQCQLAPVASRSYTGSVALSAAPCPSSLKADWNLDTEEYPFHNGANAVQVCASDLATIGNPNTSCTTQGVEVDNSCVDSSVAGGEVLSAQFAESERETLTVGFGKEATVTGSLRTDAGDPVRGATLCVKMQTLGIDSSPANVGTVQTDASGHYSYSVPPGPNRELEFVYRHDSRQIVRNVRYYAHARPSLKLAPAALHNGQRVHLWGHLQGPRAGRRVVIIQASAPGSTRWITFRKATTTPRGLFSSGYRFRSTSRRTRYRFRALVPRQAGYPWVAGHSPTASVLVRP